MPSRVSRLVLCTIAGLAGILRAAPPNPIDTLVETEREFARTAAAKGWRDAFLDYFADDAIALGGEVAPARPGILARPSQPASAVSLAWEPRTGDIASSGELGWLTGPSTFIDHTDANGQPRPVTVRTGDTNGSQTEVTSGELEPGAQVITGRLAAGALPAAAPRGAPGGR